MKTQTAGIDLNVHQSLEHVKARIDTAALAVGRDPSGVSLIAVSKTHPANVVLQAIEAGVGDLGENRVQEAEGKIEEIGRERVRWHLIGHLQTNKARRAVQLFDVIHSLDSTSLARRLDLLCREEERDELPVLIQVDLANEATKSGVSETELPEVVSTVLACERLKLIGLMVVPPYFKETERVRPYFQRLRELRDGLESIDAFRGQVGALSMGMTNDFEVAIEEGATMVRIGTAIFGERGGQHTV